MSKQLNYGDLSRFVGKPVGQQFAKKRYAEGETVADELTGSVTYEDINGKKRTYRYNPDTHTKPQPSGRMRRTNIDYTQLANNPGINIFDRATLAEEPAAVVARQQQDVPVSVAEDFWTDSDIDYLDTPARGDSIRDRATNAKETIKALRGPVGQIPVFGKLATFLGQAGIESDLNKSKEELTTGDKEYADIKESIAKGLTGPTKTKFTESPNELTTRDMALNSVNRERAEKGLPALSRQEASKKTGFIKSMMNAITGGVTDQTLLNAAETGALASYIDGIQQGRSMNEFGEIMGEGGFQTPGVGGWGEAAGSFQNVQDDINAQQAAQAAANQQRDNFYGAMDQFQDAVTAEDDEASNEAFGDMYSDVADFSYFAKGGIAQLAPGGIAPSDKHLDPGSFVISADVVSGVGDGSTESGIERMSGLLGIPLDGSVAGPDGSMLGRVTTAAGPVPGTGLSDSVSTVIQDTSPVRLNVGNNPLKQMTPQGKTAARVARDELVVDTRTIANLPQMFMGAKGPDLKQGQQMLTNFMDNVRANKTNTGGKQPGPLVPEGQDVMKGLASLFQRA
tara:strand:+ start:28022 stop:29719 length:1698 start_codon:yes stop_codon:yes gene_type:complete